MRIQPACLILVLLSAGCHSDRAELQRTRAELQMAQVEIATLNAKVKKLTESSSYLDELEKLASLQSRNVISSEEFERRKQAILETQKVPMVEKPATPTGMDELATQIRDLHALFNSSSITEQQRTAKKALIIQQAAPATDMRKDLETVKALFNASMITSDEQELLRQKLLGLDSKSHGHN